jgi:T4 RnlA family RNA ligase
MQGDDVTSTYDELMTLPAPFRHTDHEVDGRTYRTFCYAYVSDVGMWQHPGALECRGHTWDITDDVPLLASLPMGKFFNLGENELAPPSLDGHTFAMRKLDGSLIMTYATPDGFGLKTKMSFDAPACVAATAWLADRPDAYESVRARVLANQTICFEWTAPTNRIVVDYKAASLTAICTRYHDRSEHGYTTWAPIMVGMRSVEMVDVDTSAEGVEGFVLMYAGGGVAKVKTEWYLKRHLCAAEHDAAPTKGMVVSRMVDAVLDGIADDMAAIYNAKGMTDMTELLRRVEAHVAKVRDRLERDVHSIMYAAPLASTRKGFAQWVKARTDSNSKAHLFPLVMQAYTGDPDYPRFWRTKSKRRALFVDTYKDDK